MTGVQTCALAILVPDVGGEEVEVIEVLVAVGDDVDAEASLITVESDKASMDIPAPFAGTISDISVKVGDKISQDQLIMKMSSGADAPQEEEAPEPAKTEAKSEEPAPAKEEAQSSSSASQVIEVTVPDIGGDTDVEVIEILVSAGDSIEEETGLVTLETDKATMDVPSPKAGVVKEVKLSTGDKVSEGSLVILLEVAGSAPAQTESASQETQAAPAQEQKQAASAPDEEEQASGEPETIEVTVPDIGGDTDVEVIEVLVAVGDKIEEETGLKIGRASCRERV